MPFFFLLSGYLFSQNHSLDKPWKKYVCTRFQRLMIPYYCFGAFSIIISILIRTEGFVWYRELLRMVLCLNLKEELYLRHNFWFLACMFTACVLCWLTKRFSDRLKISMMIPGVVFLAGDFALAYFEVKLPFQLDNGLLAAFFIILGYEGSTLAKKMLASKSFLQGALLLLCTIGLILCVRIQPGSYLMYANEYGNYVIAQIGAICGSVAFTVSMSWISRILFIQRQPMKLIMSYILWVSDRTIPLFPIHLMLYYFLSPYMRSRSMFLLTLIIIVPITNLIYRYIPIVTGNVKRTSAD